MDLKSSAKDFKQPYTELRENDRVDRARQMVENDPNDIGIVVDDDGFLKGVLTPSDIVLAADLKDQLGKTLKEAGIYKDNVVKCSADDTLEQVLRTMDLSGVKTVVIVKKEDKGEKPIGVISRKNLRESAIKEFGQFRVRL